MTQKQDLSGELKVLLRELESLKNNAPQGRKFSKDDEVVFEQKTEDYLIKPFLRVFGYETSSVVPNKIETRYRIGKRIADMALLKDNKLVIVLEAKRVGTDLTKHYQQLSDYFNTTDRDNIPTFGILTNGEQYNFYDSEENRMSKNPCFTFNLSTDSENEIKLSKLSSILSNVDEEVARSAKMYTNLRDCMERIFDDPPINFLKEGVLRVACSDEIGIKLHEGSSITVNDALAIKLLFKQIYDEIINDEVIKRLKSMEESVKQKNIRNEEIVANQNKVGSEFTEMEREALFVVRLISSEIEGLDPNRITEVDYPNHCHITLDGQPKKKKICTLYFNNPEKLSISINENDYDVASPFDINKYKEEIKSIVKGLI